MCIIQIKYKKNLYFELKINNFYTKNLLNAFLYQKILKKCFLKSFMLLFDALIVCFKLRRVSDKIFTFKQIS